MWLACLSFVLLVHSVSVHSIDIKSWARINGPPQSATISVRTTNPKAFESNRKLDLYLPRGTTVKVHCVKSFGNIPCMFYIWSGTYLISIAYMMLRWLSSFITALLMETHCTKKQELLHVYHSVKSSTLHHKLHRCVLWDSNMRNNITYNKNLLGYIVSNFIISEYLFYPSNNCDHNGPILRVQLTRATVLERIVLTSFHHIVLVCRKILDELEINLLFQFHVIEIGEFSPPTK